MKPAKERKESPTVKKWKETKDPALTAIITVMGEFATKNPKRKDAARRFGLYKTGQTVEQYIQVCKDNGITPALARADVRWDMAAGFISVQ